MPNIHLKAHVLCLLRSNAGGLWDYQIVDEVSAAYGYSGAYWTGSIRVLLAELFLGGLVGEFDSRLDDGCKVGPGKVLVKYQLTSFGQQRMLDTGIVNP